MTATLLLLLFSLPAGAATLGEKLAASGLGFSPAAGLTVQKEEKAEGGTLRSEELVALSPSGDRRARVVITKGGSPAAIDALLRSRRQEIADSYLPRNLGNGKFELKDCRPKPVAGRGAGALRLWADHRYRFGACGKGEAKYAAIAAFTRCPWGAAELYYYFPPAESDKAALKALREFSCLGKEGAE